MAGLLLSTLSCTPRFCLYRYRRRNIIFAAGSRLYSFCKMVKRSITWCMLTHAYHCWTCFCRLGSLYPITERTSNSTDWCFINWLFLPSIIRSTWTQRWVMLSRSSAYETELKTSSPRIIKCPFPTYVADKDDRRLVFVVYLLWPFRFPSFWPPNHTGAPTSCLAFR